MDDVFDLKDFIITILRKWKMIIILALICCVIGGTYKLIPVLVAGPVNVDIQSTLQKDYQQALDGYKIQKNSLRNQIVSIKLKQNEVAKHNTDSILMQIDPYNVNVAGMDICVDTGYKVIPGMAYQTPDYAAKLVSQYALLAQNGPMYDTMIKSLDLNIDERYLREIINISDDLDNNILSVRVFSSDPQLSAKIKDYIYQYFTESKNQLSDSIGQHTLQVINNSSYTSVDMDIYTKQKTYLAQSSELTKLLSAKNDELNNLVQPDEASVASEISASVQPTFGNSIKSILKFMLFGFFGGILFGVLLTFFLDVFDDSIQSESEIKKRFNLQYLGGVPGNKKRGAN
jgi:hypothetical protein